jgi:hypothetical protein
MNPPVPAPGDDVPSVAGVRVRPGLTLLLYVLLVASAITALGVQTGRFSTSGPVRAAAPWAFLAFAVGFSVYRLALASVRKYSAFKAFFQVGSTAVFCMYLFFGTGPSHRSGRVGESSNLAVAMKDPNPTVRALAAELAAHRPEAGEYGKALVEALKDSDPAVRTAAHESLVSLNGGIDLGPAGDAEAMAKWAETFK